MTKRKLKDSEKIRKAREAVKKFHDPPQVDLHKTMDALKDLEADTKKKEEEEEEKE